MIRLFRRDCMELMRETPDKYYDLAVVDPPYGIGADKMNMGTHLTRKGDGYPGESTASKLRKNRLNSGGGKLKNRILNTSDCSWDSVPPSKEYFNELFRISKNQIIWGGNYFDLPPTRGVICWDKCQPWENFSQFELAWTSFDKPAAMFRYSNTGGANAEKKIHPTQKPVALYCWIYEKYVKDGWKLLDTHGGSMSSVVTAIDAEISIDCCEIDAEYFGKSVERVQRHASQLDMFRTQPVIEVINAQ